MDFKIFPDILKIINNLSSVEQEAIKNLFKTIHPTYALQKELLGYLLDIKERDNKSIIELVKMVDNIAKNPVYTREQKLQMIRSFFRKYRYPIISKAEEIFNEKIKALNLPPSFKIIPPPYWEGDTYEIRFNFKNNKEFKEKLEKLIKISQTEAWQYLINGGWFEEVFPPKSVNR